MYSIIKSFLADAPISDGRTIDKFYEDSNGFTPLEIFEEYTDIRKKEYFKEKNKNVEAWSLNIEDEFLMEAIWLEIFRFMRVDETKLPEEVKENNSKIRKEYIKFLTKKVDERIAKEDKIEDFFRIFSQKKYECAQDFFSNVLHLETCHPKLQQSLEVTATLVLSEEERELYIKMKPYKKWVEEYEDKLFRTYCRNYAEILKEISDALSAKKTFEEKKIYIMTLLEKMDYFEVVSLHEFNIKTYKEQLTFSEKKLSVLLSERGDRKEIEQWEEEIKDFRETIEQWEENKRIFRDAVVNKNKICDNEIKNGNTRAWLRCLHGFSRGLAAIALTHKIKLGDIQKELGIYLIDGEDPNDYVDFEYVMSERMAKILLAELSPDLGEIKVVRKTTPQADKFLKEVEKYNFSKLEKLKGRDVVKYVENLVREHSVAAAQLKHIGYFEFLKDTYGMKKKEIIRHCAKGLGCSESTFSKYFYSLHTQNPEKKYSQHNASIHLRKAEADFLKNS